MELAPWPKQKFYARWLALRDSLLELCMSISSAANQSRNRSIVIGNREPLMKLMALLAISSLAITGCAKNVPQAPMVQTTSSIVVQPSEPRARWFYGHLAPTTTAAVASEHWRECVSTTAIRLDDHISTVMDVATAIQGVCIAKEESMVDAINIEYFDKNPGIASNISIQAMVNLRQSAHIILR